MKTSNIVGNGENPDNYFFSQNFCPSENKLSLYPKTMFRGYIEVGFLAPLSVARPGGSVVNVSDSWPGGCEFDPRLRQTFFPAYFCFSPLQKQVRNVVGGFGKKICVRTHLRNPGNACASLTAMI